MNKKKRSVGLYLVFWQVVPPTPDKPPTVTYAHTHTHTQKLQDLLVTHEQLIVVQYT